MQRIAGETMSSNETDGPEMYSITYASGKLQTIAKAFWGLASVV